MNLVFLSVCEDAKLCLYPLLTHWFQELVQGYGFLLDFQDEFQIAQQSQKLFRGGIDG